jgi:hypothetical protein
MADCFADLAILSRALLEIDIYQPWAATFEDENRVSGFSPYSLSQARPDVSSFA